MSVNDMISIIERLGFPIAVVIVMSVFLWRVLKMLKDYQDAQAELNKERLEYDKDAQKQQAEHLARDAEERKRQADLMQKQTEALQGLASQGKSRDEWLTAEFQGLSSETHEIRAGLGPLAKEETLTTYAQDTKSAVTNLANVAKATFDAIKSFEALYASKSDENAGEVQSKLETIDKRLSALVALTENILNRIQKNEERKQDAQDSDSPTVFVTSVNSPALPDDGTRTADGNGTRRDGSSGI